jgi:hypothetical protein
MTHNIACFRCGASLSRLSLPLTRRDQCPECFVELHVCKMCIHFDPAAPSQCREDDAEDVKEKELANFCEWYTPSETAFNPQEKSAADQALEALETMFSGMGDSDGNGHQ